MFATVTVGAEQSTSFFNQTTSNSPEPPVGELQLPITGISSSVSRQMSVLPLQTLPNPIFPPKLTLSQTVTGVPAQLHPSA